MRFLADQIGISLTHLFRQWTSTTADYSTHPMPPHQHDLSPNHLESPLLERLLQKDRQPLLKQSPLLQHLPQHIRLNSLPWSLTTPSSSATYYATTFTQDSVDHPNHKKLEKEATTWTRKKQTAFASNYHYHYRTARPPFNHHHPQRTRALLQLSTQP